jgi:hypothetical protein
VDARARSGLTELQLLDGSRALPIVRSVFAPVFHSDAGSIRPGVPADGAESPRERAGSPSYNPGEMAASEIVFVVEEDPDGGLTARAVGASIFTEADDMDALREALRDAVRCHFDDDARPRVIRVHRTYEEVFAA